MFKFTGGAVIMSAKDVDLKWWGSLGRNLLGYAHSKGCHLCLMKNNRMWLSVDGESSENLQHICQLELQNHFRDTKVEIDPLCSITESMLADAIDFELNDECVKKILQGVEGTPLPDDHLIIAHRDDRNVSTRPFRKFIEDFKKTWPQKKDGDFHFIFFKNPNHKGFYLYAHVENLSLMGLNATFKRIGGYDLIGAYFTQILTLEKLKEWSVSFDSIEPKNKSLWTLD